jgi:enoyl-CoA hydratase/carnithine racemase
VSDADELVVERRDTVVVARLNRPDARNALTPSLLGAIGRTAVEADADPGSRVLVITGTGDRAFCAGMDLRAFAAGGDDVFAGDPDAMANYWRLLRGDLSIPVVAAANGAAVGGGLELLLGCDIVVASDDARFGFPEVQRGLFPAGRGTMLGTRVPMAFALELTLTGDLIGAERAREIGLVNAVVPRRDVLATALTYAERLAANAPLGLAAIKELVRLGVADPERWETRAVELQQAVFASDDATEGATAFVERRAPVWRGR